MVYHHESAERIFEDLLVKMLGKIPELFSKVAPESFEQSLYYHIYHSTIERKYESYCLHQKAQKRNTLNAVNNNGSFWIRFKKIDQLLIRFMNWMYNSIASSFAH